ncbi:ECF transporter S component [Colidextribacter sp. OB.20]|uniref:ECF transporter S component n=1 Tax=Colidextribacter sp. OB.20 TaxID=2304568 RepID=UPI00136BB411|nr:ECF transporter S component [Colidextribacter sp. OB.20]NBI10959.1 ECF transporter S component [Colidextribacter sp. OB.20]
MKKKTDVRYLAELSLLTAIVLIMAYTPLGYLKTPWGVEITFIVVPVAVGSIVLGPKAGAFLGLVFGLTSFAQCFGASPLGVIFLQESPLGTFFCCVVNRVLVGVVPGLLYLAFRHSSRLRNPGLALCCFLTPALNTLLYIVGNWIIFHDTWLNVSVSTYGYTGGGGASLLIFMMGMVAVNGLAEAATCLVLGAAVCKALEKTVHRNEVRSAA